MASRNPEFFCEICDKIFKTLTAQIAHNKSKAHIMKINNNNKTPKIKKRDKEKSSNKIKAGSKDYKLSKQKYKGNDFNSFFTTYQDNIIPLLRKSKYPIKYSVTCTIIFKHQKDNVYRSIHLASDNNRIAYNEYGIKNSIDEIRRELLEGIERSDNELKKSGWIINGFSKLMLHTNEINTLMGKSYVELPFRSNSVINIKKY
jgi:uncharacterized C2H2 Zn-finger protein